jgi:hypothetical protein
MFERSANDPAMDCRNVGVACIVFCLPEDSFQVRSVADQLDVYERRVRDQCVNFLKAAFVLELEQSFQHRHLSSHSMPDIRLSARLMKHAVECGDQVGTVFAISDFAHEGEVMRTFVTFRDTAHVLPGDGRLQISDAQVQRIVFGLTDRTAQPAAGSIKVVMPPSWTIPVSESLIIRLELRGCNGAPQRSTKMINMPDTMTIF